MLILDDSKVEEARDGRGQLGPLGPRHSWQARLPHSLHGCFINSDMSYLPLSKPDQNLLASLTWRLPPRLLRNVGCDDIDDGIVGIIANDVQRRADALSQQETSKY